MTVKEANFKTALEIAQELGLVGIQKKGEKKRRISFKSEPAPSIDEESSNLKKVSPGSVLSPNHQDDNTTLVKENNVDSKLQTEILSPNNNDEETNLVKENLEEVTSLENLSPNNVKHKLVQGQLKLRWKGEVWQFSAIEGQGICAGGSLFLRMIRCGKKCRGCPHGPYLIEKRKIAGVWKQRCIGKANRLGAI